MTVYLLSVSGSGFSRERCLHFTKQKKADIMGELSIMNNIKNKKLKNENYIYIKLPLYIITLYMITSVILVFPIEIYAEDEAAYYIPGDIVTDYCVFSREILLFIVAAILVLYFAGERIFPDNPLKPAVLVNGKKEIILLTAAFVYLLWSVISSVFSDYSSVSFWGFPGETEGIAAVLGYVILFLAAYNYFSLKEAKKMLNIAVFGAGALIGSMSVIEFFIPIAKMLFGYEDERNGLSLLFGNSSSCGAVCAVLFPASLALCMDEKSRIKNIAKAFISGMLMLCVFRSQSSVALYSALLTGILVLVLTALKRQIRLTPILTAIIPSLVYIAAINISGGGISSIIANLGTYDPSGSYMLTDIKIQKNELGLINNDGKAVIILSGNDEFRIEGENASKIKAVLKNGLFTLDLGYKDPIYFQVTDGNFHYIGINGYIAEEIDAPPFPELSWLYKFGTGRGYIWLNTATLLKDCVIKGVGAGEFVFYYPQNDIVGSLNTHGTTALITAKPHNMYLQIFVLYGFPALAAFLTFVFIILKRGFKFSISRKYSTDNNVSAALTAGILSFLFSGIANDSISSFSIWFWFFAGALLAATSSAPVCVG